MNKTLREQLLARAKQWNVSIERTHETTGSFLAFGTRGDIPVVLKLSKHPGDEWNSGDVLRAFNGDGVVKVYESEGGAVLLERLDPGDELVTLVRRGDDDAANDILSRVMQKMAHHIPPEDSPTVFDWARGFDRYWQSGASQLPADLVHQAQNLYLSLANSQGRTMLLHGDLQHYNVIFDSRRGWVAIDPKGIVGELEYEIGAIIRNPVEHFELFDAPEIIQRRIRFLANALSLDQQRALAWSFAQAVLSAIWDIEDGFSTRISQHTLKLAQTIRTLL